MCALPGQQNNCNIVPPVCSLYGFDILAKRITIGYTLPVCLVTAAPCAHKVQARVESLAQHAHGNWLSWLSIYMTVLVACLLW